MKMKSEITDVLRMAVVVAVAAMIAAVALFLITDTAFAGEYSRERSGETRIESKFYGTVERIPKDLNGIWVVSGRQIVADGETRIEERHGRAEVGAYVKVEGNNTGKDFMAHEIEVKQSKR